MKIRSVRSTVAFTLASILLLLTFPRQAFAATALNTGTIVISNTQQQGTYDILYDGLDIYLQAADFEKITRYTYRETEEAIAYTLGQKTLVISKSGKHPVQIPALGLYENYGLTLKEIVQSGKTYISVSELLPWLNVSVSEKDGMLIVVPDDISFWEVCADLNSSKDLFNLSEDFGDSAISKTGLAAMLTYNMVTGLKLDNVLDNTNTDEVISSYEKIYIDMSTDETLLTGEANAFVNKVYTANNNINTIEKVFGINEDAFHSKTVQTLLEQGMTDEWQAFEDFASTWDDARSTVSAAKTVADYLPLLKMMKLVETQFYTTQDYKTYLNNLTNNGTRTGVEALALKRVNAELESRQSAAVVTLLSSLTKNLESMLKNPQVSGNPFCEDISLYLVAANLFYSTVLTVNPAFSDMSNIATYSSIMNRSWSEGVQYTSQVATKDNLLMATESYKVALKASKTCFNTLQKTTDIRLLGFIKVLGDTSTLMKYRTDPIDQKIAALSVTAKYRENDSVEGKDDYKKTIREDIKKCQISMNGVNYSGSMLTDELWVIEPQYSFDRMIPLYSCESDTCGYGTSKSIYAVQKDGEWSLFNSESGAIYLSDISSAMPFLYGNHELYLDIDAGNDYQTIIETQNRINGELRQNGARFALLGAHGGYSFAWSQLPADGKIYRTYMSVGLIDNTPIDQVQSMNLIGVRQAEESGDFPGSYGPIPYSSYAVGNSKGELLTEYIYDNVCMAGESLIACQNDEGLWGYVNQSGVEIIPCEYQAAFEYSFGNAQYELPYPDMSGLVVVKNRVGDMLALDMSGQIVIRPGKYEDMSPARDGCIWVKQNGLWGLLQIDSAYTVKTREISLPGEAVQPDVVIDAAECLSTVTLAEHGLSVRIGPGTDYEKIESVPYNTTVWICGYSSDNPDWAVIQYGNRFGWVSTEYLR